MIPVILTVLEVIAELSATPDCALKLNTSGAVSVSCATHEAFVPPLIPLQDQVHGGVLETADAVPVAQRFVVGEVANMLPLAVPQTPLTTAAVVVDVSVPDTPPMTSVVVTAELLAAALVCRTQTVWLLLTVPAPLVKVAVQPIE